MPSQNFDLASKLAEIALISQRAEATVREQTLAATNETALKDGADDALSTAAFTGGASSDLSGDEEQHVDSVSNADANFDAAGIELIHDLGELAVPESEEHSSQADAVDSVAVNSVAVDTIAVREVAEDGSLLDDAAEPGNAVESTTVESLEVESVAVEDVEVENVAVENEVELADDDDAASLADYDAADKASVVNENSKFDVPEQSVDVDLGLDEAHTVDENQQHNEPNASGTEEGASADTASRPKSAASRIDIHLIDLGDIEPAAQSENRRKSNKTNDAGDEQSYATQQAGTEATNSEVTDADASTAISKDTEDAHASSQIASDEIAIPVPPPKPESTMTLAQRLSANVKKPTPKRSKVATVHAFKQILTTGNSAKDKPRYVENFTPQDMTRPLVHRDVDRSTAKADEEVKTGSAAASTQPTEDAASIGILDVGADGADVASADTVSVDAASADASVADASVADTASVDSVGTETTGLETLSAEAASVEGASIEPIGSDASQMNAESEVQALDAMVSDDEEAAVIAEIEALSESARIEADLVEAFADIDNTAESIGTTEVSKQSETPDDSLKDEINAAVSNDIALGEDEFAEPNGESSSVSRIVSPTVLKAAPSESVSADETGTTHAETDQAEIDQAEIDQAEIDQAETDQAETGQADQTLIDQEDFGSDQSQSLVGMLKKEHKGDDITDVSEQASSNSGGDSQSRASNESSALISESTGHITVREEDANAVTMAELYDTPDYTLDDTTSFGFGGVPSGSVTNPQGHFVRMWVAVKRATRRLADRAAKWIKRRK